jgi:hypothetical protein
MSQRVLITDEDWSATREWVSDTWNGLDVLRGSDKRKPLILTDRPGRKAFWPKRLACSLFDRQLVHMGGRIRQGEPASDCLQVARKLSQARQQQPKEPS